MDSLQLAILMLHPEHARIALHDLVHDRVDLQSAIDRVRLAVSGVGTDLLQGLDRLAVEVDGDPRQTTSAMRTLRRIRRGPTAAPFFADESEATKLPDRVPRTSVLAIARAPSW
ncbi:hypothetical protein GCM10027605_57090 [Micromonospora zhanjiangensis]